MKTAFRFFSIFSVLLLLFNFNTVGKDKMRDLILNLKHASYTDSAMFFFFGREAIGQASRSGDKEALSEINIYYGNFYSYTRDIPQARKYFERAILYAKIAKSKHFELLAKTRITFLEVEDGNENYGEKDLHLLLEEAKKSDDKICIAELFNLIGIINEGRNKTKEAAKFYLEGLTISEVNNLEYYPSVFYNNLGLLKFFADQPEDALVDFKKGLEIARNENNRKLINTIQLNICLVLNRQEKFDEAKAIFTELLSFSRKNKFPLELASTYINFGSTFTTTQRYDMALPYFDSAIAVLENHNLKSELSKAYLGKSQILTSMHRYDQAVPLIEKSRKINEETGNLEDIANHYYASYSLYSDKKDFKNALGNYLKFSQTRDSLQSNMNNKIIQELQVKYKVQKKEIELERERRKSLELEKKNQDERFLRSLIIGTGLVSMVVILSIIYVLYSRRIRKAQENFSSQLMQVTDEERARIARDLHDDLGQTLSIIKSKISKISSRTSDDGPPLENDISVAIEQTRQISRNLYPSILEKVGLIRSVASSLEIIQRNTDLQCSYEIDEDVEALPLIVKTHLFRIFQECTNNTIKHAGASALKISIVPNRDSFQLIYQDNGKGFGNTKGKMGIGLLSIKERVKIINGSFSIDNKTTKGIKLVVNLNKN